MILPTTIGELMSEADPDSIGEEELVPIRIYSSDTQEWGILSVYMSDGELILDVEKLDDTT